MRKKIIIGIILLMIIAICIFICMNISVETEYTPEPEIEDKEYRNTVISLYFQNKETKELQIETKLIDSKELFKNPYNTLITMLLAGPASTNLENCIPLETKLISTVLEGDCLIVNLSKEFIESAKPNIEEKMNSIYAIVNTVTELKEVSSVKILIEGEEGKGFEGDGIKFDNVFVRTK